jgi:hypothetical protein
MTQQRKQQRGATSANIGSPAAAAAAAAGLAVLQGAGAACAEQRVAGSSSVDAFCVEPKQCVVPAGQQQKFTVKFSSWQAGVHAVNLVGRQCFVQQCEIAADGSSSSSNSSGLTATLWPRQDQQQQQQGRPANEPLELIVSGEMRWVL